MYVAIESGTCVGCGSCEAICPEVFSINAHGIAQTTDSIDESQMAQVKKAARMCPVNCIFIEEE